MIDAVAYLALIAPTFICCVVACLAWKRNKRASIPFQLRTGDVWGVTLGLIPTYTVLAVGLQRSFAGHEWGALACLLIPSWLGMVVAKLWFLFHDSDNHYGAGLSAVIIFLGAALGIIGTVAFWVLLGVFMLAAGIMVAALI